MSVGGAGGGLYKGGIFVLILPNVDINVTFSVLIGFVLFLQF